MARTKKPPPHAFSLYFSILFCSVQFILIHFSTMWFIGMACENEMPKHQDKRSALPLSLCWSNQVLNESILLHTHTHTLPLSIFPSPNVSLTPQGGLIELAGRHGSFSIDRPAESLIPFPMAFITTLRFLALTACRDFLTCTANIRSWKEMLHERIQYSNWTAGLASCNELWFLRKEACKWHWSDNKYLKEQRHCLGWTQFVAAINEVAKGNWVIIMYSNTIYIAGNVPSTLMNTTDPCSQQMLVLIRV